MQTETGAQLLARLSPRPNLPEEQSFLFPKGVLGSSMVEISGNSGVGKTEVLLHIMARYLIPSTWKNYSLNGPDAQIIFINNDQHPFIEKLASIIKGLAENKIPCEEMNEFVSHCLEGLIVFHPASSVQFLLTLHSLDNFLNSHNKVAALVIDTITEFYWEDRNIIQQTELEKRQRQVATFLRKYRTDFNISVFASRQVVWDIQDNKDNAFREWSKLVTHRLLLSRNEDCSFKCQITDLSNGDEDRCVGFVIGKAGISPLEK